MSKAHIIKFLESAASHFSKAAHLHADEHDRTGHKHHEDMSKCFKSMSDSCSDLSKVLDEELSVATDVPTGRKFEASLLDHFGKVIAVAPSQESLDKTGGKHRLVARYGAPSTDSEEENPADVFSKVFPGMK